MGWLKEGEPYRKIGFIISLGTILGAAIVDGPGIVVFDAQFNLGVFFLQQARYTNAISCFEAALKLRPDSAAAHFRLGQAQAKVGKISEASRHFQEALRLRPDFPGAEAELNALSTAGAKTQ